MLFYFRKMVLTANIVTQINTAVLNLYKFFGPLTNVLPQLCFLENEATNFY